MAISPITSTPIVPAPPPPGAASAEVSSRGYMRTVVGVSLGKNVLDMVRAGIKIPEAARAGRLGHALLQTITAAPTTTLIDPSKPTIATAASRGMSFTQVDSVLYRAAAFVGIGLGAFQVVTGVRNLHGAIKADGATAVYDTRRGRAGAMQTASGALTLGVFGKAMGSAAAAGVGGPMAVIGAAATSGALTSPVVMGATLLSGGLVLANDRGFLDFMDRGEERGFVRVQQDSWHALDVPGKVATARDFVGL